MKTFSVLISCLTLTSLALAEQGDNPKKEKKHAQQAQPETPVRQVPKGQGGKTYPRHAKGMPSGAQQTQAGPGGGPQHGKKRLAGSQGQGELGPAVQKAKNGKFEARQFRLANKPKQGIERVSFENNYRIKRSETWNGPQYVAFRNYRSEWHNRSWWHAHHSRIVFVFGAPYFWDAGWWYPCWGYSPSAVFYFNGPIYSYRGLDPGQSVANVQFALQEQGYYTGEIDGILGELTRAALARYQEDHGLYITAAIDEPTLATLGMV